MQVSPSYLEHYAVPITEEPVRILLNGYEKPGSNAKSIDDADETYLSVNWFDDYPEGSWGIAEGTNKRKTFVIVKRGMDSVYEHGYQFDGLIKLDDLRDWYRENFEIREIENDLFDLLDSQQETETDDGS